MPRYYKPDPYCGFKDDRERRMALNVRAVCFAVVAVAWAASPTDLQGKIQWLMTWFH